MIVASKSNRCSRNGAAPHVVGMPPAVARRSLGPVGDPVERPAVAPAGDLALGLPGGGQGPVAGDGDDGVVARAQSLQSIEEQLGKGHGGESARADALGECAHRREDDLVAHASALNGAKGWAGSSEFFSRTARRGLARATRLATCSRSSAI